MARAPWTSEELYAAAERWANGCLRRDESLFTGAAGVWSRSVVEAAAEPLLVDDVRPLDYLQKLKDQTAGLSDDGVLFTAELLYIHILPVADTGATAKRNLVETILGWMRAPVPIPPELIQPLSGGVASYGSGSMQRDRYVKWLLRFLVALKQADDETRARVLADPWELRAFAHGLGGPALMQREALLHLVFPDTFEYALAPEAKRKIVRAFKRVRGVAGAADEDRALAVLRSELDPVLGERLVLYRHAFAKVWQEPPAAGWEQTLRWAARLPAEATFDTTERDYKLVVAERLAAARAAVLGGGDWLPLLRAACGAPNNMTSWQWEHGPFLDWCQESPEAASRMLVVLWGDTPSLEARVRDADELLPKDVLSAPAARLSLLSLLLLAIDPMGLPSYRSAVAQGLGRLVGVPFPDAGAAWDTYSAYIDQLDELRLRLLLQGVALRDRLDAQSIAWWLVNGDPPTGWSVEDKALFLAFRGEPVSTGPEPTGEVQAAWLVRGANVDGVNAVPDWVANGYVSIGWHELGELTDDQLEQGRLLELVRRSYPDDSPGSWSASVGNLTRFLRGMLPGHLVLTVDGDKVYVGRIAGLASYDPAVPPGTARRRPVEWLNADAPASRKVLADRHPGLYSKLRTLLTVTNLREDLASVLELIDPTKPRGKTVATLPAVSDEIASELLLPRAWLQEAVADGLAEKRQVIFYGPPGTGKTYVAQKLAEHFTKDGGAWELIQFHPAYSYEDFFEGYRPEQVAGGNGLAFQLTHGPLRRMAKAATEDPGNPYLLIVDEINRGNVPKIFGELLFLLEYRDRAIPLQYSPDPPFALPPNLYLIGTMNTADRSIALVDAALRRRFYFVPFMPAEQEIGGVLRAWLDRNGLDDEPARLLEELNRLIARDELAIGPSYLMTRDGSAPNLERVWRHAIMPLLEEHYYGTSRSVHDEFRLDKLRAAVARPVEETNDGESPAEVESA